MTTPTVESDMAFSLAPASICTFVNESKCKFWIERVVIWEITRRERGRKTWEIKSADCCSVCSETVSPLKRQKFLSSERRSLEAKTHCSCFCRVECLRVSGGLRITCFYSLMVQINSSHIHGVIVGRCPEMAVSQRSSSANSDNYTSTVSMI